MSTLFLFLIIYVISSFPLISEAYCLSPSLNHDIETIIDLLKFKTEAVQSVTLFILYFSVCSYLSQVLIDR